MFTTTRGCSRAQAVRRSQARPGPALPGRSPRGKCPAPGARVLSAWAGPVAATLPGDQGQRFALYWARALPLGLHQGTNSPSYVWAARSPCSSPRSPLGLTCPAQVSQHRAVPNSSHRFARILKIRERREKPRQPGIPGQCRPLPCSAQVWG